MCTESIVLHKVKKCLKMGRRRKHLFEWIKSLKKLTFISFSLSLMVKQHTRWKQVSTQKSHSDKLNINITIFFCYSLSLPLFLPLFLTEFFSVVFESSIFKKKFARILGELLSLAFLTQSRCFEFHSCSWNNARWKFLKEKISHRKSVVLYFFRRIFDFESKSTAWVCSTLNWLHQTNRTSTIK